VLVVDVQPPATGANMVLTGSQSLIPSPTSAIFTLAGIVQRIITSTIGGATSVDVVARKLAPNGTAITGEEYIQPLTLSRAGDLWFGDIQFKKQGVYQIALRAKDGAGQIAERDINLLHAAETGIVTDAHTKKPLGRAKISVFEFKTEQNNFVLWPGEIFNQANPYYTQEDGTYRFIVPPGKYYLKIEKEGYKIFYTAIMKFDSHQTLNLSASLTPRSHVSVTLPIFGAYQFTVPEIPDLLSIQRVTRPPQVEFPPERFASMIGRPAPLFSLADNNGADVDIRYLRGKKIILSVWSTWSPLAQAQIPILNEIHRDEATETQVLLLSLHESEGVINTYLRRGGYAMTSVIDREGKLTELYPIYTLPQHFFLDRAGIVREVYSGFLEKEKLLQKLEEIP
jgi:peroxiredoxin